MGPVYLPVSLQKAKFGLVAGKIYYYAVPAFVNANGVTVQMTDDQARTLFLSDQDGYKKLLDQLPTDAGCSNWVNFGDLIVGIPDDIPTEASVLRIAHILNADGTFEILAELQNATSVDKAIVSVVGTNGTGWSQTGKYQMEVKKQTYNGLTYSYSKIFSALKKGDSVDYFVSANAQITFLKGSIVRENGDVAKGPVWGSWKPAVIKLGLGYGGTLPADAATGTGGTVSYQLKSKPSWFSFAENTRNYTADPTPTVLPSPLPQVTFVARDTNGSTEKTFELEFAVTDMFMGVGWFNGGPSQLIIGLGPDDDKPYTVKLSALYLPSGSSWSTKTQTAGHTNVGLNAVGYPWSTIFLNVPIGVYLITATRNNGDVRYALFEVTGNNQQLTITPSKDVPTYTPPAQTGYVPTAVGDIFKLVADAVQVTGYQIEYTDPTGKVVTALTEGGTAVTASFYEKLSGNGRRLYAGSGNWRQGDSLAGFTLTQDANVPARATLTLAINSINTDRAMGMTFVFGGQDYSSPLTLVNVDPTAQKPVRQAKADDIYWEGTGAKTFPLPSPWFDRASSLKANSWNNTSKSPLPDGLTFNGNLDAPSISISASAGTIKTPIRFEGINSAGSDTDDINFQVIRPATTDNIGVITSAYFGYGVAANGATYPDALQVWIFGEYLKNTNGYAVRYRESSSGAWNSIAILAPSGNNPTAVYPSWYAGKATGVPQHLEFQVYKTATNEAVGPIIKLDFTYPAYGTQQSPQLFYQNVTN